MPKKIIHSPEELPTKFDQKMGSFIVYDWMAICLGLSLLPLLVFALIFSVTVGGDGCWHGSHKKMAKRLGVSRRSIIPALQALLDRGLITKVNAPRGYSHRYAVSRAIIGWYDSYVKIIPTPGEENTQGDVYQNNNSCEEEVHNNIEIGTSDNTNSIYETHQNSAEVPPLDTETARGGKERKSSAKKKEKASMSTEEITSVNCTDASSDFVKFQSWIITHAAEVAQMKQPFTEEQYRDIKKNYDASEVADVLEAMSNDANLTKKYVSAYKTCKSWLKQRKVRRVDSKPASSPTKFNKENRLNANDEWER